MSAKVSRSIIVSSAALLVFSFAQMISCFVLIGGTGGNLGGEWWVGAIGALTAIRGLRLPTTMTYRYVGFFAWVVVILAIVGSAILGVEYSFFNDLESCGDIASQSGSGNCPSYPNYDCYGNSAYYASAGYCVFLNPGNDCSCVENNFSSTGDCYEFDNVDDCNDILTSWPSMIHAAYSLTMVTLFLSLILACVSSTAIYRPQYLDSELVPTTATVVSQPQAVTVDAYVLSANNGNVRAIAVPGDGSSTRPATVVVVASQTSSSTNPMNKA